MDIINYIKKNNILVVIIVSFAVSALVGGVFGYYGATFFDQTPSIIRPTIWPRGTPKITSDEEQKVISVVKHATPSVVSIVASKDLTIVEQQGIFNPFQEMCQDPFFRQFLGDQCNIQPQPPKTKTEKQQISAGSGFIISYDGLILTNKHVVSVDGAEFTVITSDGKKYPGKVLAKDPVQDLAILKIDAFNLQALNLGDSSQLQIGQTVIAIGNALGQFSNTVSKGVVSGLSRSIVASSGGDNQSEKLDQLIQTDAAINPGNSGGPLLNLSGEVVGINVAVAQGAQNIGFTIPINQAKRDINQVKTAGKISYAFLGISYVDINEDIKKEKNLPVNYGVLVIRGGASADVAVVPDSPAAKAGIVEGDIILEINGKKITPDNSLAKIIQSHKVGDKITLKILSRNPSGQTSEKSLEVILGERK